jgi:hypothetical protein
MKTTATEVDDGFILNGTKTWISGVPFCDCGIVYAMTDKAAKHKGMSAFFVDFKTPGVVQRAITSKLGLFCAPTGEIFFEEAKIPKSALVGKLGQGFAICMTMLNFTRLSSAARATGVAQACIEEACKYANEREQFGQAIGQFQMVQEQIGRMSVEHEAAKLLLLRAAWQKDQGMNNTLETSMAKYYCAESANFCASEPNFIRAFCGPFIWRLKGRPQDGLTLATSIAIRVAAKFPSGSARPPNFSGAIQANIPWSPIFFIISGRNLCSFSSSSIVGLIFFTAKS